MYKLKRSMHTETAHLLPGHPGLCKHIHGHSYKWTVVVATKQLVDDMVMDFGKLKAIMNEVINKYDHAVVVTSQDRTMLGKCERVIVYSHRPTAERMASAVYAEIAEKLPVHVTLCKVTCRETENNEACYSEPLPWLN